MSRVTRIAVTLVLALAASLSLAAQEMRRGGGDGLPPYNTAKETTVTGDITGTEVSAMPNGPEFLVLNVTANGQTLRVLVAPQDWLKEKGIAFTVGTRIEATGVGEGMHYKGDAAMMARQLKVGAKTIAVRAADGTPAWEKR